MQESSTASRPKNAESCATSRCFVMDRARNDAPQRVVGVSRKPVSHPPRIQIPFRTPAPGNSLGVFSLGEMQFTDAPGCEPHINPSYRFGNRQLAHCHLARPSSLVKALVRKRKRILKRRHRSRIGGGRPDGTRVLHIKCHVSRTRIALALSLTLRALS
jgi:hypothetical protein